MSGILVVVAQAVETYAKVNQIRLYNNKIRAKLLYFMKTKEYVIPQVRTYTRCGTGSVVMFDYAESPKETIMKEIPYRQTHGQRSLCCSLCLTE